MGRLTDTAASVFNTAARGQLAGLDEPATSACVARILGLSRSYWHRLCSGDRPASTRAVAAWIRTWAAHGYPEIRITLDRQGVTANLATSGATRAAIQTTEERGHGSLLIACIDLETTGLDPTIHEILEIGVIRVRGDTLAEVDRTDILVRPERIEDADPEALRISGWSEEVWGGAVSLSEALQWIAPYLERALLMGHNVSFDRSFLTEAWRRSGVTPPAMDHHLLDTATLAWPLYAAGIIQSLSLSAVCAHFGIDRIDPHRALLDAQCSLEIARRLLPDLGAVYARTYQMY